MVTSNLLLFLLLLFCGKSCCNCHLIIGVNETSVLVCSCHGCLVVRTGLCAAMIIFANGMRVFT